VPRPNRGIRLERNERGVYEVRWSEGGRSRRVSARTTSPVEAADFLKAWQGDVEAEADKDSAGTVAGVLARYFEEHTAVAAAGTAYICRRHLEAHFGARAPSTLRPQDVREYTRRRAKGLIGRPSVAATVRRELVVLVAALNHAVKEHRLSKADVPVIPLPQDSAPTDDWLTEDEVARLFAAAAATTGTGGRMSRVERWLFLAYHTGRRTKAIETLKWSQVDLDLGVIDFEDPDLRRTKKRRGAVAINDTLLAALLRARREKGDQAVYVLDHASPIRRALVALGERAGVPRVHPHLLKHTCITHMLRRNVSVWDVAGAVATSAATIERVYGKHVPAASRAAMGVLSVVSAPEQPALSGETRSVTL
jgi:integrase